MHGVDVGLFGVGKLVKGRTGEIVRMKDIEGLSCLKYIEMINCNVDK